MYGASSNKFPATDVFKALTSGDRVYGELKGKDGFSYYPQVKLLNAGNSVPLSANTDGTSSIIDRMVFLMFNQSIARERWNVNLVNDLLAERDVICSLAMQGLRRLVADKFEFIQPEDSVLFAEGYGNMLNAFNLFVKEACVLRENARTGSQQIWDCYKDFCDDNNFPLGITRQLFAQKLAAFEGVKKVRVRENGKQITIFKDIEVCSLMDDVQEAISKGAENGKTKRKKSDTKIRNAPTTAKKSKSSCTAAQGQYDVQSHFLREG